MSKALQTGNDDHLEKPSSPEIDGELTHDEILETLSNRRRRYALHYLRQSGNVSTIGDVAEQVAAWEHAKPVTEVSADERKSVYTSLQQFHLPKMDKKGVVDFDRRSGAVELGEAAEAVDIYLGVTDGDGVPWSVYYLALGGISAVLVALSWLGVPPLARVPNAGWLVLVLAVFTLFALGHTVLERHMRVGGDNEPPDVNP